MTFRLSCFYSAALLASIARLSADVHLASPFTSHMVLQRDQTIPVWGTADEGEKVIVEFAGQKKESVATAGGRWKVLLDPLSASAQGQVLAVSGSRDSRPLHLDDVLVGEVWLCSGQSNMDFTVAKTAKYYFAGVINEAEEVAAANHPTLRMFTGDWTRSYEPQNSVGGSWKICTPDNVREFSAIGYFFARALENNLKVPVGIVTLTYGASTAQAWIRRETIAADARLKPVLDQFDAKVKGYQPPSEAEMREWQERADKAKAEGKKEPRKPKPHPVQDQHNPTVMYNGMIAPFVGFGIRGVLWYQGESITEPKELFPLWNETLITDWRKLWGRELPFYFCQLAAHDTGDNLPQTRAWQAQALRLPETGMAVTIDIGDRKDVHPHNKAPVGERLSRIALARVYGRSLEFSGPQPADMTVENAKIRIKFAHVGSGLSAKEGPPGAFEIAGPDGRFVPAVAEIENEAVVVHSGDVSTPTAVRYAWANFPERCNLYNSEGLPAAPFWIDRDSFKATGLIK